MKRIIYFAASVVLLMTGCNKTGTAPAPEQYDRYIFFSQDVETKASLIESAGKVGKFGVVGFMYDDGSSWANVYADAEPNVFYDENGRVDAEEVTSDADGYGTYAPLQGWSNTKRYTFLAYCPYESVTLVAPDGSEYERGIPAIKYTMNSENMYASMTDVMTAPAHTNLTTSDSEVQLKFDHRLSSLGVKVTNSSAGEVVLNSVSLKLENIMYQTIIIPLYGDNNPTRTEFTSPHTEEMALADVAGTSILKDKGTEISDKLIFIPQETPISVQVTVGYTRKSVGDDSFSYEEYTETRTLPAQTTDLEEGKKHLISLKFTDSTVEVKGVASSGWKEPIEVEDTFN